MAIGKIAVLGGGPGSHAIAGDLALRGFEVHFWGRNPERLARLFQFKRITMVGFPEGVGQLADATDDLGRVVSGAELVIVALPGSAHDEIGERCSPLLGDGQVILVCSNSAMGAFRIAAAIRASRAHADVVCADLGGAPVGGRFLEPAVVNRAADYTVAFEHYGLRVGVFPARRTAEAMDVISETYPGVRAAENCLAASLGNRAIQHQPVAMLMSAAAIEHLVYWDVTAEGQTPSTLRVVQAVDEERKAIQRAWGFAVTELYGRSHLDGRTSDWDELESGSPGRSLRTFRLRSAWKDRLDMTHRFVSEAVPYGLTLRSSAARKVGLETPVTDSLIRLLSVISGEDYFGTGMSLDSLGLGAMDAAAILGYLDEGAP